MRIDIATLFPDMCETVLNESIIGRARKNELVTLYCHNIRDYTQDKHNRVDDTPYGGGMESNMINFFSFSGVVTDIYDLNTQGREDTGCNMIMSVRDDGENVVNFVVSPDTYFLDQEMIHVGDFVTGYYNGNAPAILIYPPQFPALIVVKYQENQNVKVDFFNSRLVSSDGMLRLNIGPDTLIMLKNGQAFRGDITNRNLIVVYGPSTRSIPAVTTPEKIIVWC